MKLSAVLFWMACFFSVGSILEKGFALTLIGGATLILAAYVSEAED